MTNTGDGSKRFPPESECQLCRPLGYRGDEINDKQGVVTIARDGGGTETIHCCERCADELWKSHDWTSYDDLDNWSVSPGIIPGEDDSEVVYD